MWESWADPHDTCGWEAKMRRLVETAIVLVCGAAAAGVAHAGGPLTSTNSSAAGLALQAPAAEDGVDALLAKSAPAADAASVNWTSNEVRLSGKSALRIRVGEAPTPAARTLQTPGFNGQQAYEVSLVRDWPAAVSFETERFGVDLTPHAGVGVTSYGGLAEAGATVELSQHVDNAVKASLGKLGVRDGAKLGNQGRWYLFAAASGRAVGLNMLPGESGLSRAGWTTDPASTLVGDAQVGVGWRKGPMQTSFGFVHREMKSPHTLYGQDVPKADSMVAFSFAVRPRR
jgi:hypothetical protein